MCCAALGEDTENLSHEPLHPPHPSETGLQQQLKLILHTTFQTPTSKDHPAFLVLTSPSKPHARQPGPLALLRL